jgi:hypothetical protein
VGDAIAGVPPVMHDASGRLDDPVARTRDALDRAGVGAACWEWVLRRQAFIAAISSGT